MIGVPIVLEHANPVEGSASERLRSRKNKPRLSRFSTQDQVNGITQAGELDSRCRVQLASITCRRVEAGMEVPASSVSDRGL